MPSISKIGISNKNDFEKETSLLFIRNQEFHMKSKNTSTEITNEENKPIIRFFYRESNEIRIDVKKKTIYEHRYNKLLDKGLAFQKDSANPNATEGWFAFFIDKENQIDVLKIILNIS